jgi:hypothetical protein
MLPFCCCERKLRETVSWRLPKKGECRMSDTTFTKQKSTRWIFVTRLLMVLGLLCFLYSGSLYYAVFFDETKIRASRELSFAGISCWIAALLITARIGLFRWRR